MLIKPPKATTSKRPVPLWHLSQRPTTPVQPLFPFSEQELLRQQMDAQTRRYMQSYAKSLFDPGINPIVAERIQRQTGIDDTHFRTGMQTAGSIAGVPASAYGGKIVGAGMAKKAGITAGAKIGAKVGSVVPIKGTAIGAAAGAVIGGVSGFFTGKAIGGSLTPTGIYGIGETIMDRVKAFGQSPAGGTLESLALMGNTIDQLWGAPVVKAGILSLQREDDVWDQLKRGYGDHEDGFTRMAFSQIRKNTGLDIGGVGNGIVDFLGEMATDPGIVKTLFMGGLHRKATRQGQRSISQFASPGSATAAIGVKGQKRAAKFVIDGIHNKQKALTQFKQNMKSDKNFMNWWRNHQKAGQIQESLHPFGRFSQIPDVPIIPRTYIGRQQHLSKQLDTYLENLYDGYSKAMLGDLPSDFIKKTSGYYQNKDNAEEIVNKLNKQFGKRVDIHDNLVGNLNLHSQRFNKIFTREDVSFLRKHYPNLRRAENFDQVTVRGTHRVSNPILFGGIKGTKSIIKMLKSEPGMRGIYSKIARKLSQGRKTYVDIKKTQGIETVRVTEEFKNMSNKWKEEYKKLVNMENKFSEAREKSKKQIKQIKESYDLAEEKLWDEYHRQIKTLVNEKIKEARDEIRSINDTYVHVTGKYTLDKKTVDMIKKQYSELMKKTKLSNAEYKELQEIATALEEYYVVEALKELTESQKIFTAQLDAYMTWLDNLYETAKRDFIADLQRKGKKTIDLDISHSAKREDIVGQINDRHAKLKTYQDMPSKDAKTLAEIESTKSQIKSLENLLEQTKDESKTILFDTASPTQQKMAIQQWMASRENVAAYLEHMQEIERRIHGMIEELNKGTLPMTLDELAQTSRYSEGLVNRLRNHRVLKFLDEGPQITQFKRKVMFDSDMREGIETGVNRLFAEGDANNIVAQYIENASLEGQLDLRKVKSVKFEDFARKPIYNALTRAEYYSKGKLKDSQYDDLARTLENWYDLNANKNLESTLEAYDIFGPDVINIKELEEPIRLLQQEYGLSAKGSKSLLYDFFNDVRKSKTKIDEGTRFNLPEALDRDKEPIKRIFDELGIEYSADLERLQKRMDYSSRFAQQDLFANPNNEISLDDFPKSLRNDIDGFLMLDDDEKIQVIQNTLRTRYDHRYIKRRGMPQHKAARGTRFKTDGGKEAYVKDQRKTVEGTVDYIVNKRKKRGLPTSESDKKIIRNGVEELIGPTKIKVGDDYYRGFPYAYDMANEGLRKRHLKERIPLIDIDGLDTTIDKRVSDVLKRHTETYEIMTPTADSTRLLYPGSVGIDLNHLSDDEVVDVVNRIYGQNFELISDMHKKIDYLDDAVRHDINTSIHVNGKEVGQSEFIQRYGLDEHYKEYQDIMNSTAGNYVKYKKVQRIQDSVARQFDYFQVNKDMVHMNYAMDEDFTKLMDEFLKAFSGDTKNSLFGLISDLANDTESPFMDALNNPEHGLTKFLTRLKNAKFSNDLVKNVVMDPKINKHQSEIMAPMYDYLKRISNRDYFKMQTDGTLTWRSIKPDGTWDDQAFRGIIKDMAEVQKSINEQYLTDATPEVMEAMTEVYKNIERQVKNRYEDIFKKGLDSDFASTRLYGEVNANLINDMYKISHDLSKILMEAEGVVGRWDDPGIRTSLAQISRDDVGYVASDAISNLQRHMNEIKELLGEFRHGLRVTSSHNNQLKRFLFTTSGTHVNIDTPQLFSVGDLPRTGSPFTYRQSPYKREIVKLKKSLNRHINFDTYDIETLAKRQKIMGKFPGDAPTKLGEKAQPQDVSAIFERLKGQQEKIRVKEKKIRNLEKKRQTALHKEQGEIYLEIQALEHELDVLKSELDVRLQEFEDLQMFPDIFKSMSSKYSTLSNETAMLISEVDNPATYDIYTFLNMLDDYYVKPTQGSKFTRGRAYFEELLEQDPALERRADDFFRSLSADRYTRYNERLTLDGVKAAYGRYKLEYHDSYHNAVDEAIGSSMDAKIDFITDYRLNFQDRLASKKRQLGKTAGHYSEFTRTSSPENLNRSIANTIKEVPESQLREDILAHSVHDIPEERLNNIIETIKAQRVASGDDLDFTSDVANELRYLYGGRGEWVNYTENQLQLKKLQKELIELRDGGNRAPENLRGKEQELETQIRKLKRVQNEGEVVVKFESEWVPSELEDLREKIKMTTDTRVERVRLEKQQHLDHLWNEHYQRFGHKKSAKYYKTAEDAQQTLIKGDLEGFKKMYIQAGGTEEEAAVFIEEFQRTMKRFDSSPKKFVTLDKKRVKETTPTGKIKYRTEKTKGPVNIDDATQVSEKDIINYKYEYTNSIKEDIQETLAKKEFMSEFDDWVKGADAPPTREEFMEQFAHKYGADMPFVKQQNTLENFYEMTLDEAGQMFKDGQALNDFLIQNDEYILVATVPDSSAAAKTPTKYRKGFEGEKVHEGSRQIIHGPDHKIEVPYRKVKEGETVLKDGRFEDGATFDQVEEAAFLQGHYESNKPVAKKVLYNAEELDDLIKSDSPIKSHIGLVTKDQYKVMARMSYREYKLPPVLDYYYKNILRLQKQDMLLNSSWHPSNMIDMMRKNSQMMESIWDTKDYVEHLANAMQMYSTWDAYKKLLISEKLELIDYMDKSILNGNVTDATLAHAFIQDLKAKGLVGYVRENHTTFFNKNNITNPVFKGQNDPGTLVYRKWKKSKQFTSLSEEGKINFLNEKVDDYLNMLDETDFFQTSSATTDLPEFIRKMEEGELYHAMTADRWLFRHLASENPIMRANMKVATTLEQVGRLHGYLLDTHLYGTSRNRAVANSLKRHFDYSDRTAPELYATILLPFNAFPTRNALFWAEELEKAGKSRRYYHFINSLWGSYENDEHSDYAQYMKSKGYIPIGNTLLKVGDSRSMAMDMGTAGTQTAQNRLNPIIRGAADQLKGSERERSMASYLPLIRRGPELADQIGRIRDEGAKPQTLLPGLFGTIYRDHEYNNPVYRTQRNPYKQLFNQQGRYRQLSNHAYYRVRQIQNEQHRRRRL